MWSYYGSKSKIVNYYPPPKYDKIIEPFAGSARYSLKYFDREVILVDKYDVIVRLWKWLQECKPSDILKLPKLKQGEFVSDFNLSYEEGLLVGFLAGTAQGKPRNKISPFAAAQNGRHNQYKNIAKQLFKIKHWKIIQADYTEIENQTATWFIDPPYQFGGQHQYHFKNKLLNFSDLAIWSEEREGQIIVCENTKANWMNFLPMRKIQGAANSNTTEAIWTNLPTSYSVRQSTIKFT